MTFLLQIKKKTDGTFEKGTSEYAEERTALIQMHTAMSSAMSKLDTLSIMCLLTDEFGSMKKKEFWEYPIDAEPSEEKTEEVN